MTVLVTGANGFIGSNVCLDLLRRGMRVRGLVRASADRSFLPSDEAFEMRVGDIADPSSLDAAMAGVGIVYHVAALCADWGPWEAFERVNVAGVENVMRAARRAGVRRVVHVSSVSAYGFPGHADIREDAPFVPRPTDPYVTSKAAGERVAFSHHGGGLEVAVVRPALVYGPHDRTTTLKLAPALQSGAFIHVDGGRHLTSPAYVDNVVEIIRLAGERPEAAGEAFNAADGGRVTWRQFIGWMCEDLYCAPPKRSAPKALAWPAALAIESIAKLLRRKESPLINAYRVRTVMNDNHYSIEKAERMLGYRVRVPTRDGVRRAIAWYKDFAHRARIKTEEKAVSA